VNRWLKTERKLEIRKPPRGPKQIQMTKNPNAPNRSERIQRFGFSEFEFNLTAFVSDCEFRISNFVFVTIRMIRG